MLCSFKLTCFWNSCPFRLKAYRGNVTTLCTYGCMFVAHKPRLLCYCTRFDIFQNSASLLKFDSIDLKFATISNSSSNWIRVLYTNSQENEILFFLKSFLESWISLWIVPWIWEILVKILFPFPFFYRNCVKTLSKWKKMNFFSWYVKISFGTVFSLEKKFTNRQIDEIRLSFGSNALFEHIFYVIHAIAHSKKRNEKKVLSKAIKGERMES